MIQIIDVQVSPDLGNARVKVSVIGDRKDKISAVRWLQGNTKGLRHKLAQNLQHMKRVPSLHFSHVDVGRAVDVMTTIEKLSQQRARRDSKRVFSNDIEDGLDFGVADEDAFTENEDIGEQNDIDVDDDSSLPLSWRDDSDVDELFQFTE